MKVSVSAMSIEVRGKVFSCVLQHIIADDGAGKITVSPQDEVTRSTDDFPQKITLRYDLISHLWEPDSLSSSLDPELLKAIQASCLKLKSE